MLEHELIPGRVTGRRELLMRGPGGRFNTVRSCTRVITVRVLIGKKGEEEETEAIGYDAGVIYPRAAKIKPY